MNTVKCSQCSIDFTMQNEELEFYKKINIPEPLMCPPCRRLTLLSWRNQRVMYNRKCDATDKDIISIFAPNAPYTVYDRDYWWSESWDPLKYGADIDFTKTFAEQYDALLKRVPMAAVFSTNTENCLYVNHTGASKNCYLVFAGWASEDLIYCDMPMEDRQSVDCLATSKLQNCYQVISGVNCFNTNYSIKCERCNDSWFLFDCKNCDSCFGCTNLRNKKYCIFNVQYSKEDYDKKIESFNLHSRTGIAAAENKFKEMMKSAIHRFAVLINCQDSTGDNLVNSKNTKYCFDLRDRVEDCAYCINGGLEMKDVYDGYGVGAKFERGYGSVDTGVNGLDCYFCTCAYGVQFAYYCYNCHSSFELFGCSGVRNKKYCIFNKEYSKEEYLSLKARLIVHMKETGEWGKYLSGSVSPFGYNETLSFEYKPLKKEEALARGFKWQDNLPGTRGKETLKPQDVPDSINNVQDSITKEILVCACAGCGMHVGGCGKNYKIIKQEIAFYKNKKLPVPIFCPECRYATRLALRNPHVLFHRACMCNLPGHTDNAGGGHEQGAACKNEFETTYAPERPERVFCEECYKKEVI